ncbi:hypothetical protein [Nonomuraea sp. NPDC049695]|uniref:hypothetical protein n=1 Tax=Nonomuraea sp. NPDC049695 TaxID=3154734 RepID=UPI0034125669
MSLFATPDEHAAHPPTTWKVVRAGTRHWTHATAGGVVIGGRYDRKRDAEAHLLTSSYARLWDQESRWYAGEPIDNWRPYAELLAERQTRDAWRGRDAPAEAGEAPPCEGISPRPSSN